MFLILRATERASEWNLSRWMNWNPSDPAAKSKLMMLSISGGLCSLFVFLPVLTLKFFQCARRLPLIIQFGWRQEETLTTDSPGIWGSMEKHPIVMWCNGCDLIRPGQQAESEQKPPWVVCLFLIEEVRRNTGSVLGYSPRSCGPNRFWGFVSCQIQDPAKKYTKPHWKYERNSEIWGLDGGGE